MRFVQYYMAVYGYDLPSFIKKNLEGEDIKSIQHIFKKNHVDLNS